MTESGHESIAPSCLVSTEQAGGGGVMVWGMFFWHTLGPLIPTEHNLNATPCRIHYPQNLGCSGGNWPLCVPVYTEPVKS
jgi:hypothetical protein